MTVCKYFLKLFWENRGTIILYFLIFILIAAMNNPKEKANTNYEEIKANIGYIDNSKSELSKKLLEMLGKTNNLEEYIGDKSSQNEIREYLLYGIYDIVIVFPSDFEEKVIQGEKGLEYYVSTVSFQADIKVHSTINNYLSLLKATNKNGEFDYDAVDSAFSKDSEIEILELKNSEDGIGQWSVGYYKVLSYLILSTTISVVGMVVSDFNKPIIAARNTISSITSTRYNLNQFCAQVFFAIVLLVLIFLIPIFLQGPEVIQEKTPLYLLNAFVYILNTLCLVFLLNKITIKKNIISAFANVYSLGTSFISGIFIGRQFLGEATIAVSKFLPSYYYVNGIHRIKDGIFPLNEMLIQIGFGALFIVIGIFFSLKNRNARI